MSQMSEAIQQLVQEKGLSIDSIKQMLEMSLKAAYKRAFGTAENCVVKFEDDMSDVAVYSRKTIVDGVYDPVIEIELEDALKLSSECELGDEIDIIIDTKKLPLSAVSTGKQAAHQELNESVKNRLLNEYRGKVGEIIIGYYQRMHHDNIYVDLGKIEGVLPKKFQSPIEQYNKNDRIKALVVDVKPVSSSVQLVLSRSDPKFVQAALELEVPEIQDKIVEIKKCVRTAGYRTKIAVASTRDDVDPVGACVGLKGVRIQNVIKEIEGEKIDVLKYDENPEIFIKNALSPAEVKRVIITDSDKKQALAIVSDSQFSLAIGRQGQNVRLANKLCDWSIDVKTESDAAEMDLSVYSKRAVDGLFNLPENAVDNEEVVDISRVSDIPEVDADVAAILRKSEFDDLQAFVDAYYDGTLADSNLLTGEQIENLFGIIHNYVEIVDDDSEQDEEEAAEDEAEHVCPECGAEVTPDMTKCPKCGVPISFVRYNAE
ncbi:transcription termination factor NusA [Treponema saccharophilum]|uniref:Transcription termination/antitermination protein NusA n=2 Tax=Treponema saccharophilum TaxID=165 RepID=H7EIG4_9SPIR|nr:transcription termination factor NusA [Treponema saccharophilum]EIC02615.1 NusA antitermination factor [Treponema saccharophilum DSM 2985]BDC96180.1 transcription termination/antitermination protein NusA [Treponema saccharophilum]